MMESLRELNIILCLLVSSCSMRVICEVRVVIFYMTKAIIDSRRSTVTDKAITIFPYPVAESTNLDKCLYPINSKCSVMTIKNCIIVNFLHQISSMNTTESMND